MNGRYPMLIPAFLLVVGACAGSDGTKQSSGITGPFTASPPVASIPPVVAPPFSVVPSAPSAASGPALSGLALISDDYSRYATTADLQNQITSNIGGTGDWRTSLYNDGHNANLIELDQSVRYNGHATVKYNQPAGVATTPALWPTLPHPVSKMWFRAKIRFSPGFTTTGTLTNSSNAYKLLGWGYANSYGSGRVEITNTSQYQLYFSTLSTSNVPTSNEPDGVAGNIDSEWSDGGWYDYIIEYENTSPTTATARLWFVKDGNTPVLRTTASATSTPGNTMPQVLYVMLGLNFNQVRTSTQSQALWYGQWEVVDGSQHPNPFGLTGM